MSLTSRHLTCLSLHVIADLGQIGVRVGPEITQAHERLAAGVVERHPFAGPLGRDEDLVLRHLAEPDEVGAVDRQLADQAAPLHRDQTVSPRVLDRDRAAGLDRQLAGAEELLAVDRAVDDPLVDVARRTCRPCARSARGSCSS